ncbi:hypothetical protein KXR08_002346 [Escherichia coli]|uniref:hypothetical protein n=1 Tax=Escherichia coli TaxID=562 RepID=UPI00050B2742|nr:hypothetical protein [Escherichia coli]EFC1888422.1 hypothetical protein [Escherichia coli]EFC1913350.1 hypothetical protein [Escherichia coli]EFC1974563.1 hypothetical protein [Escherichia coli]EFC1984744.1 hypothetical protein [Escherichia coli]EFC6769149.1 hypothetical protein [Escherichia coli]
MNNESRYGAPNQDGPPGRTGENGQLQWLMKSVGELHASQQELLRKIEKLDLKVDMKQKGCAESLSKDREIFTEKHMRLEERIKNNHDILIREVTSTENRVHNAIKDTKFEIIKWAVGLAAGLPTAGWAIVQIVKTLLPG